MRFHVQKQRTGSEYNECRCENECLDAKKRMLIVQDPMYARTPTSLKALRKILNFPNVTRNYFQRAQKCGLT